MFSSWEIDDAYRKSLDGSDGNPLRLVADDSEWVQQYLAWCSIEKAPARFQQYRSLPRAELGLISAAKT